MFLFPPQLSRRTIARILRLRRTKRWLKHNPFFGPILIRAWVYLRDPVRRIRRVLDPAQPLSIVQIGSNDGKTVDPLHDLIVKNKNWRALFVEPVPFLFKRLCDNYGADPRFRFENVAVADSAGNMPFYYISEAAKRHIPNLPFWYDQLGSFKEGHIKKHLDEQVLPYVETVDIPAITLRELLERNNVERIDFLHIDAEGYDWLILRQLDLARYQPAAILVEHLHLDEKAKEEARAFLNDYHIRNLGADYFCVLRPSRKRKTAAVTRGRAYKPQPDAKVSRPEPRPNR
ncbi:MAG: FkbM family methyltransferase [Verrucomicrobia bacterium]|nr:FkbM family methyltransferase [Verrucomicrobiota bacterium]